MAFDESAGASIAKKVPYDGGIEEQWTFSTNDRIVEKLAAELDENGVYEQVIDCMKVEAEKLHSDLVPETTSSSFSHASLKTFQYILLHHGPEDLVQALKDVNSGLPHHFSLVTVPPLKYSIAEETHLFEDASIFESPNPGSYNKAPSKYVPLSSDHAVRWDRIATLSYKEAHKMIDIDDEKIRVRAEEALTEEAARRSSIVKLAQSMQRDNRIMQSMIPMLILMKREEIDFLQKYLTRLKHSNVTDAIELISERNLGDRNLIDLLMKASDGRVGVDEDAVELKVRKGKLFQKLLKMAAFLLRHEVVYNLHHHSCLSLRIPGFIVDKMSSLIALMKLPLNFEGWGSLNVFIKNPVWIECRGNGIILIYNFGGSFEAVQRNPVKPSGAGRISDLSFAGLMYCYSSDNQPINSCLVPNTFNSRFNDLAEFSVRNDDTIHKVLYKLGHQKKSWRFNPEGDWISFDVVDLFPIIHVGNPGSSQILTDKTLMAYDHIISERYAVEHLKTRLDAKTRRSAPSNFWKMQDTYYRGLDSFHFGWPKIGIIVAPTCRLSIQPVIEESTKIWVSKIDKIILLRKYLQICNTNDGIPENIGFSLLLKKSLNQLVSLDFTSCNISAAEGQLMDVIPLHTFSKVQYINLGVKSAEPMHLNNFLIKLKQLLVGSKIKVIDGQDVDWVKLGLTEVLLEFIEQHSGSIEALRFGNCSFEDDFGQTLAEVVMKCKKLTQIDLSNNLLSTNFLEPVLTGGIRQLFPLLEHFNMCNNPLTVDHLEKLQECSAQYMGQLLLKVSILPFDDIMINKLAYTAFNDPSIASLTQFNLSSVDLGKLKLNPIILKRLIQRNPFITKINFNSISGNGIISGWTEEDKDAVRLDEVYIRNSDLFPASSGGSSEVDNKMLNLSINAFLSFLNRTHTISLDLSFIDLQKQMGPQSAARFFCSVIECPSLQVLSVEWCGFTGAFSSALSLISPNQPSNLQVLFVGFNRWSYLNLYTLVRFFEEHVPSLKVLVMDGVDVDPTSMDMIDSMHFTVLSKTSLKREALLNKFHSVVYTESSGLIRLNHGNLDDDPRYNDLLDLHIKKTGGMSDETTKILHRILDIKTAQFSEAYKMLMWDSYERYNAIHVTNEVEDDQGHHSNDNSMLLQAMPALRLMPETSNKWLELSTKIVERHINQITSTQPKYWMQIFNEFVSNNFNISLDLSGCHMSSSDITEIFEKLDEVFPVKMANRCGLSRLVMLSFSRCGLMETSLNILSGHLLETSPGIRCNRFDLSYNQIMFVRKKLFLKIIGLVAALHCQCLVLDGNALGDSKETGNFLGALILLHLVHPACQDGIDEISLRCCAIADNAIQSATSFLLKMVTKDEGGTFTKIRMINLSYNFMSYKCLKDFVILLDGVCTEKVVLRALSLRPINKERIQKEVEAFNAAVAKCKFLIVETEASVFEEEGGLIPNTTASASIANGPPAVES
eukprot:GHVH01006076.1.p1 GENE.GHVH01006076.1~~GHVH01006076.1.p1  ORF type:complete len:1457 (+),score=231.00 GHVH01006076.1:1651-6021(+)